MRSQSGDILTTLTINLLAKRNVMYSSPGTYWFGAELPINERLLVKLSPAIVRGDSLFGIRVGTAERLG